jgi:predicted O-methyltransferase YrrM
MKSPHLIRLAALALLPTMIPLCAAGADDAPTSPEFRRKFLESFPRTTLNTTPGDAALLRILVESSKARRGVEVGTATGYGALHMGLGFERNGGTLVSVDIDPQMVRQARENLKAVGLDPVVTVMEGDALELLPRLTGEFDFVFIDARKRDYFRYFKALAPKLKPGTVIVADNVIQYAQDMIDFLEFMRASPDYQMVIIRASSEKGDGMAICYKLR